MDLLLTADEFRISTIRLLPSTSITQDTSTIDNLIQIGDWVLVDHWQLPLNDGMWDSGWHLRGVIYPLLTRLLQEPGSLEEYRMNIIKGHISVVRGCLNIIRQWHLSPGRK